MRQAAYTCAIVCAAIALAPGTARATDFCDALAGVITAPSDPAHSAAPLLTHLDIFSVDDACGDSLLLSGARARHCMRRLAFRSPQATALYDALAASLDHCPQAAAVADAAPVGHPDSHRHRTYDFAVEGGVWRVDLSLKDKAARGLTLLTVQVAPPE